MPDARDCSALRHRFARRCPVDPAGRSPRMDVRDSAGCARYVIPYFGHLYPHLFPQALERQSRICAACARSGSHATRCRRRAADWRSGTAGTRRSCGSAKHAPGERLVYLDLAHEWRAWTGTPWVSAFWAVREDAFTSETVIAQQLVEDFEQSRDHGLAILKILSRNGRSACRSPLSLKTYLREHLLLSRRRCLEGLNLFYRYAVECGALPAVPTAISVK